MTKIAIKTKSTKIDRQADLLLAYQYGQDYMNTNDEKIKTEALEKFKDDAELLAEFQRGTSEALKESFNNI